MLTKAKPKLSMKQFMKYTSHVCGVPSIQLQLLPLSSDEIAADVCNIVVPSTNAIALHSRRRKRLRWCLLNAIALHSRCRKRLQWCLLNVCLGHLKLSDFQCLLPCLTCLRNGCHGCRQGLLHVEEEEGTGWSGRKTNQQWLTVGDPKEGPIAAIYEILDKFSITEEICNCICIPTHPAENDEWTKMLIIFNLKPIW